MLCVGWNVQGIIHFELLPRNATMTARLYVDQLDRLNQSLSRKHPSLVNRKGVLFLHDNARPHVAKVTREKIKDLSWEVLPHPPYSPDLAPSDFHLFRSLQNHLADINFVDEESLKNDLSAFFASKPPNFYRRGIEALASRWQMVVNSDGNYIVD